jgi:hypothetical protein
MQNPFGAGSSGSYRIMHEPGRLEALGLDPTARSSNLPEPPRRGGLSPMATIRRR